MAVLDRIFAAGYDRLLHASEQAWLADWRESLLADLEGTVVELGAGTGLNLAHYPASVQRLVLTEPSAPMLRRLEQRVAGADNRDVDVLQVRAVALPFEDGSVDAVVTTLVLCSVADLDDALDELARVLRPGGRMAMLEHIGPSQRRGIARLQRVLEPVWKVVNRGCRLTRDPRPGLAERGFDLTSVIAQPLPGGVGPIRDAIHGVAIAP